MHTGLKAFIARLAIFNSKPFKTSIFHSTTHTIQNHSTAGVTQPLQTIQNLNKFSTTGPSTEDAAKFVNLIA